MDSSSKDGGRESANLGQGGNGQRACLSFFDLSAPGSSLPRRWQQPGATISIFSCEKLRPIEAGSFSRDDLGE